MEIGIQIGHDYILGWQQKISKHSCFYIALIDFGGELKVQVETHPGTLDTVTFPQSDDVITIDSI